MSRAISVLAVIVVTIAALVGSFVLGPLSAMPSVVLIDDHYVDALNDRYLLSGLLTALAATLCAEVLRVPVAVTATVLLVCGVLPPVVNRLAEPDFPARVGSNIVEFVIPYGIICLAVPAAAATAKRPTVRTDDNR